MEKTKTILEINKIREKRAYTLKLAVLLMVIVLPE